MVSPSQQPELDKGGSKMIRISYFALNARALLVCTLFAALSMGANARAATMATSSVSIVRGGRPQASIVLGEGAGELGKFAASELQRYLRTLSGAELEHHYGKWGLLTAQERGPDPGWRAGFQPLHS